MHTSSAARRLESLRAALFPAGMLLMPPLMPGNGRKSLYVRFLANQGMLPPFLNDLHGFIVSIRRSTY